MLPYELTADTLRWNQWNIEHIARHGVIPDEVEEVCAARFIVRESYGGRFVVIGQTLAERTLAFILEPDYDGLYYIVTARPASRRERRTYGEETSE